MNDNSTSMPLELMYAITVIYVIVFLKMQFIYALNLNANARHGVIMIHTKITPYNDRVTLLT